MSEEFNLTEYWEIFKDLNSQNNILGIGDFEDVLNRLINLIQSKVMMDWKGQNEFIDWLKDKCGDKFK